MRTFSFYDRKPCPKCKKDTIHHLHRPLLRTPYLHCIICNHQQTLSREDYSAILAGIATGIHKTLDQILYTEPKEAGQG